MVFLLFQLPLEIRLQIYGFYLTSPTGYVRIPQQHHRRQRRCKIVILDPEIQSGLEASSTRPDHLAETDTRFVMPEIQFTILRLNKQVYQECKGIFCAKNVVGFEEAYDVYSLKRIHQGLARSIQHLILPFDLNYGRRSGVGCLEFLRKWSRIGNLKSLTLIATYDSDRTAMDVLLGGSTSGSLGDDYPHYLALLQQTTRDGYFSHLERHIAVYSGHRKATRVLGQQEKAPFQEHDFLKDLGEAFSASVWRDDLLCFKNGVEVLGAFAEPPREQREEPSMSDTSEDWGDVPTKFVS